VKRLLQVAAAVVLAGGVAYLFVRTAQDTRSEPYTVNPDHLRGWTLALDAAPDTSGVVVALRPPQPLAPALFQQVFTRAMESLAAPASPAMPLILQQEFEQAFKGRVGAVVLLAAARDVGLEMTSLEPVCLAHRRESEPGATRQLYFAVFRAPAFQAFRSKARALLGEAGAASAGYNPLALSPLVIIGASDAGFRRWLPLPEGPQAYCVAPIVTSR
jgi:hypothetical protein